MNRGAYTLSFSRDAYRSDTGTITFSTSFAGSGESFQESQYGSNNAQATASAISIGTKYRCFLAHTDLTDYFKFTVKNAGTYTLWAENMLGSTVCAEFFNSSGKLSGTKYFFANSSGTEEFTLSAGTYYLLLTDYGGSSWGGSVDFKISGSNDSGSNATTSMQAMSRLYNPNSGEHFYTASASERDGLKKAGWRYEGIGWTAPKSSKTPVYRLYSGTDHHYTTSVAEKNNLVRAGWKYEGVGWYSDDAKGQALYRQYNPNVNPKAKRNNSGSHNYTTSIEENNSLVKAGWKAEGIGWYGSSV